MGRQELNKKAWNWIASNDEYAEVVIDGKIDSASVMIVDFIDSLIESGALAKAETSKEALNLASINNRTLVKGQKVKVLVGCMWQVAEIEDCNYEEEYYLCSTKHWSTHFHKSSIMTI